jgi:hypothetical protein
MTWSWFELQLIVPGRPTARKLFRAETVEAAVGIAQRQYPTAEVAVPAPAAKAVLVHSKNGPKQTRRQIQALLK